MNKLDLFRFGNTRKKKIRLYVIISVCVVFLALVLLFAVGVFSYRSELVTLRATDDPAGAEFARLGFNLDNIPNVNMVADSSFETSSGQSSIEVVASSSESLFFEPGALEDAGIDYRVAGDMVRVMSIDGSGVMSEKFTGTATAYQPARLGAVRQIEDQLGVFAQEGIKDAVFFQNLEYVLTGSGTLIGDASGSAFICDLGIDPALYTAATDKEIYVVTSGGNILYSQDGRNFSEISSGEGLITDTEDLFVCASSDVFVIASPTGRVISISSGHAATGQIPCGNSEIIGFAAAKAGFMAVSGDGALYFSLGGNIYNTSGAIEISTDSKEPVKAVCGAEGKFYVLSSDGLIYVYDIENEFKKPSVLESAKASGIEITDLMASDTGKIIAVTPGGTVVISEEDTLAYFASENVVISDLHSISGDKMLYSAAGSVYKAKILSELSVDGVIPDDMVIEGDLCFITGEILPAQASTEQTAGWVDAGSGKGLSGVWDIAGADTDITCIPREDGGGCCARLTGSAPGTHILSQILAGSSEESFMEDTFYRIDLNLSSEGDTGDVDVWIEGESFGVQGFTIEEPQAAPQDYSFVFAVTKSMLGDDTIRFNIAFKGTGKLIIDDIYLGPDACQGAGIPEYYSKAIAEARPYAIRLNNLNFGQQGYSREAFFGHSSSSNSALLEGTDNAVSCSRSLEDSLKLVSSAGATPWLVIGSYASASDIESLLGYLCGTASSEYGGIRLDNGTALAWSRQFDQIIIEIGDSEGCFASDTQKAAYVDFIISVFSQSEYYPEIKDKAVFLDAMEYEGGTMLSGADGHAMTMYCSAPDDGTTFLENARSDYGIARYRSPHITSGSNAGEYISSCDFEDDINCGILLTLISMEEADFINCFMFDIDMSPNCAGYEGAEVFKEPENVNNMISLMKTIEVIQGSSELYIDSQEPLSSESQQTVAGLEESLVWNAYSGNDGTRYIVVSNVGTGQESFMVSVSAFRAARTSLARYSATGRLLTTRRFNIKSMRYTIMPGEFIVITSTDPN